MVSSLLVALILIAIVALVIWGINAILPVPPQVKTVIYVVGGVVMLLILLQVFTGNPVTLK